jgi:hypothetical protein
LSTLESKIKKFKTTGIVVMFSAPVIYTFAPDTPLLEPRKLVIGRSLPREPASPNHGSRNGIADRRQTTEGKRWRMGKKKIADLLVDVLAEAGVERIYGVSGDSLNGIMDSIRAKKKFQWIHVRHEEVAAFAAGAEAHLTGKLAVCAGSSGPGNLHSGPAVLRKLLNFHLVILRIYSPT